MFVLIRTNIISINLSIWLLVYLSDHLSAVFVWPTITSTNQCGWVDDGWWWWDVQFVFWINSFLSFFFLLLSSSSHLSPSYDISSMSFCGKNENYFFFSLRPNKQIENNYHEHSFFFGLTIFVVVRKQIWSGGIKSMWRCSSHCHLEINSS